MKILRRLSFTIFAFALGALALLQFLPDYLSQKMIPALVNKYGLPPLTFDIDRITPHSLRFSHLYLGDKNTPTVSIDSGELTFTPKKLRRGFLQTLAIQGLQLHLTFIDGNLKMPGIRFPSQEKEVPQPALSKKELLAAFDRLPVKLAVLQIKNSRFTLHTAGKTIEIPFDLSVRLADRHIPHFDIVVQLAPFAEPIKVTGAFDLPTNSFQADLLADSFSLGNTKSFMKDLPINISAIAKINGQASGTIFPFAPKYSFSASSDDFSANFQDLIFGTLPAQRKNNSKVEFTMSGDIKGINAKISGITLLKPITTVIDEIALKLCKQASTLSGDGSFSVTVPEIQMSSFSLLAPLDIHSTFDFQMIDQTINGKSQTIIKTKGHSSSGSLAFENKSHEVTIKPVTITMSGEDSPHVRQLHYKIITPQIRAATNVNNKTEPSATIRGNRISLAGVLRQVPTTPKARGSGEYSLSVDEITGENGTLFGKTTLKLVGEFRQSSKDKESPLHLFATLKLNDGELTLQKEKMTFSGITATVPITWPSHQKNHKEGSFAVSHILTPDYDIGALSGGISLENGSYDIDATVLHKVIPHLTTHIMANLSIEKESLAPKATISFALPQYHFDSKEIDLPIFTDIEATGSIEALGSLEISSNTISGSYQLTLADTTIHDLSHDTTVDNLNLVLKMPEIKKFKSDSSALNFKTVSLGDTHFSGGEAFFQLENSEDLLIENSTIHWSGGKIHILGTRVTTGTKKQDITLYCEGLNLAELLSQLGVANAHGDGRVNGKISLSISNGDLALSDAFLYSTPGTGGTIQINNSEIILSGVPTTSRQYGQLDFASAALKDFKYEWVTLTLTSNGEDTVVALKLAGKPTTPLPFRYDTTVGTFVRLSAQSKGIDYPINLDVNFHLPLNKILNYGTNLKNIFQK